MLGLAMCAASAAPPGRQSDEEEAQWGSYGGDPGGNRHSPLTQINRRNVGRLEIAWTYRTGELGAGFARADKLAFEATPVMVRDSLYLSTPTNIVIALDPASGQQRWRYDPRIDRARRYSEATSRGVSSWIDEAADPTAPCAHRIIMGTLDARLIALDGRTGRPCRDFGNGGKVNLNEGVREGSTGNYLVTSPPAIYRNIVIVGSAIGDNGGVEMQRGIVRAFDARSGKQLWAWDPIPTSSDEAARRGWQPKSAQRTGAANAWSVLSVDAGRGLVFVPTGSASPDFFGGERTGDNLYANSLVALHAETGALAWHRQLVHHDVWDYDVPAQPMLIDIDRDNKSIPAVVQATKTGMLFVFDRETGEPVFEVVERPVPQSDVAGEVTCADAAVPRDTAARLACGSDAAGCVGTHLLRSRQVPRSDLALSLGRHFHAAEPAGNDPVAGFRRRRQLGQHRIRQRATARDRRGQPCPDGRDARAARPVRHGASLGAHGRTRSSQRRPAPPTACVARCSPRRSACPARRRHGERSRPSICVAMPFAGR